MPNKQEITQAVIQSLGTDTPWTLDLAMKSWWRNIRDQGGLQLSGIGYRVFRDLAQLESFEFDLDCTMLNGANLIILDKKMTCPYVFIRSRGQRAQIVMFGSREAMMATLYGDISRWVASLARS